MLFFLKFQFFYQPAQLIFSSIVKLPQIQTRVLPSRTEQLGYSSDLADYDGSTPKSLSHKSWHKFLLYGGR